MFSLHVGKIVVADGTDTQAEKLLRVLTTGPGPCFMRHVDAAYEEAELYAQGAGGELKARRRM